MVGERVSQKLSEGKEEDERVKIKDIYCLIISKF